MKQTKSSKIKDDKNKSSKKGKKLPAKDNTKNQPKKKLFQNIIKQLTKKQLIITGIVSLGVIITSTVMLIPNLNNKKIEETKCIIQFDTTGGNAISKQEIKCGKKMQEPKQPKKDGYTFVAWNLAGSKFDFNSEINNNIILVAEWEIKEGTKSILVSFNTNGGTLMAPIEIAKGSSISKPISPTKSGYKFIEWQYKGKKFDFNTEINESIVLDAKWDKNEKQPKKENNNSNNNSNNTSNTSNNNGSSTQNNCSTTLSGAKSCISSELKWSNLKGTWYLKGTDDVIITFSEDSSNYIYQSTRFQFYPSKVDYTGGQGGSFPKSMGYSASSIALYVNVTDISSTSITIDNKYVFYKQKNYPSHIESDLEKLYNNLQGTWYLDGYYKDVYVKFTAGTRNGEKVLYYEEKNFCSVYGTAYASSCYGTTYFSYYTLDTSFGGISNYGWNYKSGYLYNSSGSTKMKFSTTPTKTNVSSIKLNKSSLNLFINESEKLIAIISPTNATNKNMVWSSSDSTIATVSSDGKVSANKEGTAIITVTSEEGNKTATCFVTVKSINVNSIALNKTALSLTRGDTEKLIATITPQNATNKNVTWSSDNTSVASVNENGEVKARGKGTAIITVTSEDGKYTAKCEVNVAHPELIATGSIGVQTSVSNTGISKGVIATISVSGGSGTYNYYFITLYKDGVKIGSTSNVYSNELFISGHTNGTYTMNYEVRDTAGVTKKGTTTTTISGF